MSKNIIQSIVIILGILIVFAFLALIYGMYLKISTPANNFSKSSEIFSSNLSKGEIIKNIEVIDTENILILIDNGEDVKAAIYNIKKNAIIRFIDR
jgi:hypothetical protein